LSEKQQEEKAHKEREKREKQEQKQQDKERKTRLRRIKEEHDKSHADIVEANPHADTIKLRTQTDGKPGTRTYRLSTTHGLAPERLSKEREMEEARKQGESEHHRNIRIKTRQSEITEHKEPKSKKK
jgi:hypothetical protein